MTHFDMSLLSLLQGQPADALGQEEGWAPAVRQGRDAGFPLAWILSGAFQGWSLPLLASRCLSSVRRQGRGALRHGSAGAKMRSPGRVQAPLDAQLEGRQGRATGTGVRLYCNGSLNRGSR